MSLTKKEAISWHRRMWLWIANEIAKHKMLMDIVVLKKQFCNMFKVNPQFYCFCCEYDNQYCENCPVVWKNEYALSSFCSDSEYGQCVDIYEYNYLYNRNDWKKQAKLAYKIAMLPERENL